MYYTIDRYNGVQQHDSKEDALEYALFLARAVSEFPVIVKQQKGEENEKTEQGKAIQEP